MSAARGVWRLYRRACTAHGTVLLLSYAYCYLLPAAKYRADMKRPA